MASEVVLASHLPGEGHFRSERFRVVSLPCEGDLDYSHGMQTLWATGKAICNIEHDMECSDELIQELLDCPHPLCTHAYLLYWPSTHQAQPHYAQRHGGTNYGDWIKQGEEWCDFSGIGFCKIVPQARVRPLVDSHWSIVDCAVTNATDAHWHVHWKNGVGVEHWHR